MDWLRPERAPCRRFSQGVVGSPIVVNCDACRDRSLAQRIRRARATRSINRGSFVNKNLPREMPLLVGSLVQVN